MLGMSRTGLLTLGSVIATSAVAVWAAFWIYSLQSPHVRVLSWPTFVCVALALLGVTLVLIGAGREEPAEQSRSSMSQRGGDGSTNIQSGRDVNVDGDA